MPPDVADEKEGECKIVSDKLLPEVQKFAEEMEKQLRANEHKGGWEDCTICHLIVELRRNSYELERAALRVDAGLTSSIPSVVRRAANVANFAMMVADNWGGLLEGGGE